MDTFHSLNKLLSQLPFSILGYYQHESELDNFFVSLCASDFISQKNNIELVSYSYAKLKKLDTWETDSYSSNFFFHSLNEKYSLLALNIYYTLRNKLFERGKVNPKESPHLTNNVAIALSRLFLKDVGFRLCYSNDENWHFSFLEQDNLFSIKLPLNRIINTTPKSKSKAKDIFQSALSKFLANSISALDTDDKIRKLIIQKKSASNSTYVKCDITVASPIEVAFKLFRKAFKQKRELEKLKQELVEAINFWHRANPGYITVDDTENQIDNWVELFFQIVFISLVYDAWVEYFPSACGIQKDGANRNLGGLILGYKIDQPINQEERSLFRIISERISSTIAAQWMHEHNETIKLQNAREKFKNLFDDFSKLLDQDTNDSNNKKNRSHAVDAVDNDTLKLWKAKAVEYSEETKPFIAREDKFIIFLKTGEKTHQGLLLNVYPEKPNETFLKSKSKFYESVSKASYHSFKYDYIDFIFIEEFISLLKENKGGEQTGNTLLIECKHEGNKQTGFKNRRLEITVDFLGDTQSHFSIDIFFRRLKTAHSSTGNYFSKFILSNFNLFRIHGDLEIVDSKGTSHFILSRDAKLNSKDSNNPFLEITKENIPIQSFDKLKFIIHIQHELK